VIHFPLPVCAANDIIFLNIRYGVNLQWTTPIVIIKKLYP